MNINSDYVSAIELTGGGGDTNERGNGSNVETRQTWAGSLHRNETQGHCRRPNEEVRVQGWRRACWEGKRTDKTRNVARTHRQFSLETPVWMKMRTNKMLSVIMAAAIVSALDVTAPPKPEWTTKAWTTGIYTHTHIYTHGRKKLNRQNNTMTTDDTLTYWRPHSGIAKKRNIRDACKTKLKKLTNKQIIKT